MRALPWIERAGLKMHPGLPFLQREGYPMRRAESARPVPNLLDDEEEEERTLQLPAVRAIQQRMACAYTTRVTRTMPKIDPKLIAMARGEIEPARPTDSDLPPTVPPPRSAPPSVIPLTDEDLMDVDEAWLDMAVEPDPFPTE